MNVAENDDGMRNKNIQWQIFENITTVKNSNILCGNSMKQMKSGVKK